LGEVGRRHVAGLAHPLPTTAPGLAR
jgi:hypothetical protein